MRYRWRFPHSNFIPFLYSPRFWLRHNNNAFFREDGSEIPYDPYLNVISIYDRVPPTATACVANDDNYYKRAQVSVAEGHTYTYEASCSGKSWSGEVTAACNAEDCKLIELK